MSKRKFYEKLYTKDNTVKFSTHLTCDRKLDTTQRLLLDSDITQDEIAQSIKEMSRNKCPGPDGLSADFYKIFYVKIKDVLWEAYQHALKCGKLPFVSPGLEYSP